jgi:hypothetical protein
MTTKIGEHGAIVGHLEVDGEYKPFTMNFYKPVTHDQLEGVFHRLATQLINEYDSPHTWTEIKGEVIAPNHPQWNFTMKTYPPTILDRIKQLWFGK